MASLHNRSRIRLHSVVRLAFASDTRGLPNRDPRFRARASPATTRSDRRMFSCLAMVARMDSTASLKMPVESRYCSVNDLHVRRDGVHPKLISGVLGRSRVNLAREIYDHSEAEEFRLPIERLNGQLNPKVEFPREKCQLYGRW